MYVFVGACGHEFCVSVCFCFKSPCADSDDKIDCSSMSEQASDEHLIPMAEEVQQNPPCSLNENVSTFLQKVPSDKSLELLDNKQEKISPIQAEVPEAGCLPGKATADCSEGIASINNLPQVDIRVQLYRNCSSLKVSTSFQ